MYVDPPLAPSEIEFLSGFSSRGDIRRVWPGQPSVRCPWWASADGTGLVLDPQVAVEEIEQVTPWLRYLCHEFLAPSSIESMHVALAHRLRGGHHVTGVALVGGSLEITAYRNRISERVLVPERNAVVLRFDDVRRKGGPSGSRQERCVER